MSRLVLMPPENISLCPSLSGSLGRLGLVKGTLTYPIPNNKSNATPGTCIFFDTEAHYDPKTAFETGQYQRLRLGCAIAGRMEAGRWTREKRIVFSNAREFWDFVRQCGNSRRPVWVFAHNIGYDLTLCSFPELLLCGDFVIHDPTKQERKVDKLGNQKRRDSGFVCLDNPPVIISCNHKTGWKLICIDTFNYWKAPLAKMGEMVGRPKKQMPDYSAPDAEWANYCMGDVEVLRDCVIQYIQWIQDNDLGKFRFSAPSQALAALRHRWNKPAIKTHSSLPIRKLERQSYYGGRLQCFLLGTVSSTTYELDVTSLYPSVMAGELYPAKLLDFSLGMNTATPDMLQQGLSMVATVKIKSKAMFPKRIKGLGTVYPTGEYWTTLAGPELQYAAEIGAIKEVKEWARYELRDLFTGYVNFFWNYRKEQKQLGNELNADLAKLLMNSLYGKFGQMTSQWVDRPDIPYTGKFGLWGSDDFADGGLPWFRNIGRTVQQLQPKQEHEYAFPAISAYITAYARQWMRSLIKVAGSDNVYYVVTDALFCNQRGYDNLKLANLIADNELGMLRVKHVAESAEFEALHHYTLGEHRVTGSKKKSARVNPDGSFTEVHFESFEKILMRKPDGSVHVTPVAKKFSKEYRRGTRQSTGWVKPLELWEE